MFEYERNFVFYVFYVMAYLASVKLTAAKVAYPPSRYPGIFIFRATCWWASIQKLTLATMKQNNVNKQDKKKKTKQKQAMTLC